MTPDERSMAEGALSEFMRSIGFDAIVKDSSSGSIWIAASSTGIAHSAEGIDIALRGLPRGTPIDKVILKHIEFGIWQ